MQKKWTLLMIKKSFKLKMKHPEGLQLSRQQKKPHVRYGYGNHIHTLVNYTQQSLKKGLKLFKKREYKRCTKK